MAKYTKQEASALIASKVAQAEALIRECEEISNKSGVGFSWDIAWGMGGNYHPDPALKEREEGEEKDEDDEDEDDEDGWYQSYDYGWVSSSSQC